MKKNILLLLCSFVLLTACQSEEAPEKSTVIFDTDANNELDDQHALAYLFSNGDFFDIKGITVNATPSGGEIDLHYDEAERILQLYNLKGQIPLINGANANFEEIIASDSLKDDGAAAVDFMIEEANKGLLTIIAVGKLTNVALAVKKDPTFAKKVRLVWLGSNYPKPGEYNQNSDPASMNYLLDSDIPFEMVTVRYGEPSGTDAVKAIQTDIHEKMPKLGPQASTEITGRHEGTFKYFGDYAIDLFDHIQLHGTPPSRPLFDMVAVAIIKNPAWGTTREIPAPILENGEWKERPNNTRKITLWENFDKESLMTDFYSRMEHYTLPETK
ncbi:nucleoside hydrolase [Arcticibacterium luteifluviistationis]|uniref:Nucleoside hydrolase n=1 Tax=Arcticibacterium luteifluviistationis TaxID=1784714 RepID=A0A2Z4GE48_9BACT|nr:nucleoside hydrolase [Arcticibacterium luteifluviistationis]AWV99397.1 nucleoside hydrolase [Arcticibacterium luteifluviistationis]